MKEKTVEINRANDRTGLPEPRERVDAPTWGQLSADFKKLNDRMLEFRHKWGHPGQMEAFSRELIDLGYMFADFGVDVTLLTMVEAGVDFASIGSDGVTPDSSAGAGK